MSRMAKQGFFWVSILTVFLLSCDPSRHIEMKNRSSDTAEVVWKSQEDSIGFNPFVLSNTKTLRFVIPPHAHSSVKLSFGTGTWSPQEVEKAIHFLEYLQISTPRKSLKIESLPALKTYLLQRRKGIGKSKIEIVIEE